MNRGTVFLVRPRVLIAEERASYPLSLVTVFSSLTNPDIAAHVVDMDFQYRRGASFNAICANLVAKISAVERPVVGISTNDANLPEALYLAGLIKSGNKNSRTVLGGPGAYFNSDQIVSEFGHIVDYVFRGEAEAAFPALVFRILNGRQDARGVRVVDSPRVGRMDDYAFPRYDELPPSAYRDGLGVDRIPLLVGAGCRHQCKYCSTSNFWGHEPRYKSVERVVEEAAYLSSLGISAVDFVHDNLFADMGYVARLSEALLRRKIRISWECSGRADDFDIAAAPLIAKAGCSGVFWGVESGSEDGLRIINKNLRLEPSVNKIREVTKRYRIYSKLSFIYNYPGDTLDCFKRTVQLAFRMKSECPERTQVALNNYLALSGAVFTKSTPLVKSPYLLRQLDFGTGFRKKVMEAPGLFPFFSKPENVTTLNEEFRFSKLNLILNNFPKTLGLLLGKYQLLYILRQFQKYGDLKTACEALAKKMADADAAHLRDIFGFEYLSAIPPGGTAKRTYKLLETACDPSLSTPIRARRKCRYLFFYHGGRIDTFKITPANYRRFKAASLKGGAAEKEAILEIGKYI